MARSGGDHGGRRGRGRAGEGTPAVIRGGQMLGPAGEAAAAAYLQEQGYAIVARNYRCTDGELDLVARAGATIVFVEVKARSGIGFGSPLEAVDARKRRRLVRAARHFLAAERMRGDCVRFDVIAVHWRDGTAGVEHVANAFEAE